MRFDSFKMILIVLLAAFVFLQYRLWLEPGGIIDMVRYKKQLALRVESNAALKQRNQMVAQQIEHLQKSPDAVEARARGELGMVKKDETFYRVIE